MPLEDLKCSRCGRDEASVLLLWKKYYRDAKREAILDAETICENCSKSFYTDRNAAYERRPHLISFSLLAEYQPARVGFITGTKGWETNVLASRFWRRKIWRIRAIWAGRKKKEARLANLP